MDDYRVLKPFWFRAFNAADNCSTTQWKQYTRKAEATKHAKKLFKEFDCVEVYYSREAYLACKPDLRYDHPVNWRIRE